MSRLLKFGRGNAKLSADVLIFSLPAGYTCPFAKDCHSKADRKTGKIKDQEQTVFRCYAATMEARRPSVRNSRWHNFDKLRKAKTPAAMASLILDSLSCQAEYVRVHSSGDFFSRAYFDAWLAVARVRPATTFYAYTKALPFWIDRKKQVPENLILTASYGGTHDVLIGRHRLRYARVVYSNQEAADLGLEIDHDDSHAMANGPSFALLIHGTQPPGSAASKALYALRAEGIFGYGTASKRIPLQTVLS